jgi:hypothetical protein
MRKVNMKKSAWLLILIGLVATSLSYAASEEQQSWTYGGIEYILPKPIGQIVVPQNVPETYEVVKGDTLWGIATALLKDPFLWPMIWDSNMDTVPNPHLIFPGQMLRLPVLKSLTPGAGEEKLAAVAPRMYPLVPESKLALSGYISPTLPTGARILSSEDPMDELSTSDIVYIDIGSNQGVLPGDTFITYRAERKVRHPLTKKQFGYLFLTSGIIQVIATQESTSTAIITTAFTPVRRRDFVRQFTSDPMPLTTGPKPMDRFAAPTGKLPGCIVETLNGAYGVQDACILGTEDIVYLDLGSNNGVLPGDTFIIYRPRGNIENSDNDKFWFEKQKQDYAPAVVAGELTVFRVTEKSSTAVVTKSYRPFFIGASVELRE